MHLFSKQDAYALISTFDYFDVDRSGSISKIEMQRALQKLLGQSFNHAEMNYIMRIFDENFDGDVSFEEFLDVLFKIELNEQLVHDEKRPSRSPMKLSSSSFQQQRRQHCRQQQQQQQKSGDDRSRRRSDPVHHELRRVFDSFDTDGNGMISIQELKTGLQRIEVEVDDSDLEVIMAQMGGDEISFDQFLDFMTTQWHDSNNTSEQKRGFRQDEDDGEDDDEDDEDDDDDLAQSSPLGYFFIKLHKDGWTELKTCLLVTTRWQSLVGLDARGRSRLHAFRWI